MKNHLIFTVSLSLAVLFIINKTIAQEYTIQEPKSSIGIGRGLDYGGFGFNITGFLDKSLSPFFCIGYNQLSPGLNGGLKYRFGNLSNPHKVSVFALAMYGYNGVLNIEGNDMFYHDKYQKTFYGPTFGIGLDTRGSSYSKGYWSFEFLIPIRPSDFQSTIDAYQNQGAKFITKPNQFSLSIGYNFFFSTTIDYLWN